MGRERYFLDEENEFEKVDMLDDVRFDEDDLPYPGEEDYFGDEVEYIEDADHDYPYEPEFEY